MSPLLIANVGGEEWRHGPRPRGDGRAVRLAVRVGRLWSLLFGVGVEIDGDAAVAWPAALGRHPGGLAFAWLADAGAVPWLPTPYSDDRIEALGLASAAPPSGVVRKVHDKAFAVRAAAELELPRLELVEVLEPNDLRRRDAPAEIGERVAAWPDWAGGRYLLKPRQGSNGRGFVRRGPDDPPPTRRVLARLAGADGAILEPWVERVEDRTVQLHVATGGAIAVLGATSQLVTADGQYLGNVSRTVNDGDEEVAASVALARAAAAAGFHGPCGVDLFVHRRPGASGERLAVSELNARVTTGTIALGLVARARAAGRVAADVGWAWRLACDEATRKRAIVSGLEVVDLALDDAHDPPALFLGELSAARPVTRDAAGSSRGRPA